MDQVKSKLSLQEFARKRIYRTRTFANNKQALEIFEKELHNLKRLDHFHLVKFIGSYTDPKFVGLIMEPVADTDLRHFLMKFSFSSEELATLRTYFGCLCSAVRYLHEQNCRHKDLKPHNILIKNDIVLITDFGTALDWTGLDTDTTIGLPESFTYTYAAPEVAQAKPRNTSADIWSLGCVFLDILVSCKNYSTLYNTKLSHRQFSRQKVLSKRKPSSSKQDPTPFVLMKIKKLLMNGLKYWEESLLMIKSLYLGSER